MDHNYHFQVGCNRLSEHWKKERENVYLVSLTSADKFQPIVVGVCCCLSVDSELPRGYSYRTNYSYAISHHHHHHHFDVLIANNDLLECIVNYYYDYYDMYHFANRFGIDEQMCILQILNSLKCISSISKVLITI